MSTLASIGWCVINFFLSMTVTKWLIFSAFSLIIEVALRYTWTFWSDYFKVVFGNLRTNGPGKMFIVRQFFWPINIPIYIGKTLYLFLAYKRYEFDEEVIKDWDKEKN